MKTLFYRRWVLGLVALLAYGLLGTSEVQARPGDRVSFRTFYDELDPYGRWINDPEYGYVWSPDVERGFQPYATRGHWVMTEYGNTWVSDYDWGWAPFHYGRWMFDDYYGWLWIPGSEWGPAWVDWRNGGGYYGWAPMGPRVTYIVPAVRWVFVPVMYITSPRIYSYCVPRNRVVNIYHNTTIINNYYERDNRRYVYGPRNQDIERSTNRPVQVRRLENDSRAGRNAVADNSVRMYRPEVNNRREDAPTRVIMRDQSTTRSRFSDSEGTTSRSDRSSTSDRTRTRQDDGTRSTEEPYTSPRSRSRMEATSEQRSVDGEYTRERTRRTSSPSGEYTPPARQERGEYQRSRSMEPSGTRTSRSEADYSRPQPEGTSSPRRSESSTQRQYEPRSRQEASGQEGHSPRVRQMPTPSSSESQRTSTPPQNSSPRREGGRSGRN